jgi:hypothetical protein
VKLMTGFWEVLGCSPQIVSLCKVGFKSLGGLTKHWPVGVAAQVWGTLESLTEVRILAGLFNPPYDSAHHSVAGSSCTEPACTHILLPYFLLGSVSNRPRCSRVRSDRTSQLPLTMFRTHTRQGRDIRNSRFQPTTSAESELCSSAPLKIIEKLQFAPDRFRVKLHRLYVFPFQGQ